MKGHKYSGSTLLAILPQGYKLTQWGAEEGYYPHFLNVEYKQEGQDHIELLEF